MSMTVYRHLRKHVVSYVCSLGCIYGMVYILLIWRSAIEYPAGIGDTSRVNRFAPLRPNLPATTISPQAGGAIEGPTNETCSKLLNVSHLTSNMMRDIFASAFNKTEKTDLLNTVAIFKDICNKHRLTYWIYSGTLLGSYRHHDIIPWDDDFDVIMNFTERLRVYDALQTAIPRYEVHIAGTRLKFSSASSDFVLGKPWKWPYVDISFYRENATHVWDASSERDLKGRYFEFEKAKVFPLVERPLARMRLSAPRDTYANLLATYPQGLHLCWTPNFLHRSERESPCMLAFLCELLRDVTAFVHRRLVRGKLVETLRLGNKSLHSLTMRDAVNYITDPYTLRLINGVITY